MEEMLWEYKSPLTLKTAKRIVPMQGILVALLGAVLEHYAIIPNL